MEIDKRKQGKKNRQSGARFELKVRKDLESKGWIVAKWMNNVDLEENKFIQAKHKFCGFGRPMAIGTGFPDFIVFSPVDSVRPKIAGVESKSNGYLDKTEKQKCKWLLENQIFSKILIAKKGEKRGQIEYVEFKEKEI